MEYYMVEAITEAGVRLEQPDETLVLVPPERFLTPPREGDCLTLQDGRFAVDLEETARRRAALAAHTKSLFSRKSPKT